MLFPIPMSQKDISQAMFRIIHMCNLHNLTGKWLDSIQAVIRNADVNSGTAVTPYISEPGGGK